MPLCSAVRSLPTPAAHKTEWNSLAESRHWISNMRSQTLPNLREGTPHTNKRTLMDYRFLTLRSESGRRRKKPSVQPVALSAGMPRIRRHLTVNKTQSLDPPFAISRPDRCLVLRKLCKRIESANTALSERCKVDEFRCGRRVDSAPPLTRNFCDVMGPGLCNECTKSRERNTSIIEISKNFKQMKTDRPVVPPLLRGAPPRQGIREYLDMDHPAKEDHHSDSDSDDAVFTDLLHPRSGTFSSRLSNISSVSKEMTERTILTRRARASSNASVSSQHSDSESTGSRSRRSSVVSELGSKLKRVPGVQPVLLELKFINFTPYDKQSLKAKRSLDVISEDTGAESESD